MKRTKPLRFRQSNIFDRHGPVIRRSPAAALANRLKRRAETARAKVTEKKEGGIWWSLGESNP